MALIALGRAIRHRGDWASLILIDRRYGSTNIRNKLPKWIGKGIVVTETFGVTMKNMGQFFRSKKAIGGDWAFEPNFIHKPHKDAQPWIPLSGSDWSQSKFLGMCIVPATCNATFMPLVHVLIICSTLHSTSLPLCEASAHWPPLSVSLWLSTAYLLGWFQILPKRFTES